MSGRLQLYKGRVLLDSGRAAVSQDCCCSQECPEIDCAAGVGERCDMCELSDRGPTPDTYYLQILSEPTPCGDCIDVSARDEYADSMKVTGTSLAGTYKLEQDPRTVGDMCCWGYYGDYISPGPDDPTVDIDMWTSSTTCSGTPDSSYTFGVSIDLEAMGDGSFRLVVWIELDGAILVFMSLTWTPDCCADDSHDYVTDDASDYESSDCGVYDDLTGCSGASFGDGPIATYGGTLKVVACTSPT